MISLHTVELFSFGEQFNIHMLECFFKKVKICVCYKTPGLLNMFAFSAISLESIFYHAI